MRLFRFLRVNFDQNVHFQFETACKLETLSRKKFLNFVESSAENSIERFFQFETNSLRDCDFLGKNVFIDK